ncbi:MAG: 3-isopropylmalate dehydrogenase [Blastococcus sp.]|jgi:3-isopropylmalate dehydrogenase|nr:3-isopropylmalate dehydrogenase [Blastococcus sp.]
MPTTPSRAVADGYVIAVLPGDGIGPEVTDAALPVLDAVAAAQGLTLDYRQLRAGAQCYQDTGEAIGEATMAAVGAADAVLLGAMGLPGVRQADGTEITPQLDIRERYRLVASIRPSVLMAGVPRVLQADRIDFVTVRESTEGLFAGRHDPRSTDPDVEHDRMTITRATSEALFDIAFSLAATRRRAGHPGRVTLFDKANVLKSQAFLRRIFDEVAARHPHVETERIYIDAGAMLMVRDPARFDVIVTENAFGDIISELGSGITGGLGLAPSADVGRDHAVFQPCHGTAPDIVGQDRANPVGMLLSAAMMLEWLAERHDDQRCRAAAAALRSSVAAVLESGVRTPDVGGTAATSAVTAAVLAAVS